MKEQWKQQLSDSYQAATYKAEIHALNSELANMAEKSELKATLSEKRISIEGTKPTVEAEPESQLNTVGPCGWPSWILPNQLVTTLRPTTGGKQTPSGAPASYGPSSPETQCYRLDTPHPPPSAQCRRDGSASHGAVRDLSQENYKTCGAMVRRVRWIMRD